MLLDAPCIVRVLANVADRVHRRAIYMTCLAGRTVKKRPRPGSSRR
jgi:hypothetical protein